MRKVDPAKHEEKRQEILEAAGRCFTRSGFHGATTSAICAEANISPGHLFHYFDSKEAMIAAIIRARLDDAMAHTERVMESADPFGTFVQGIEDALLTKGRMNNALLLDMLAEARHNPTMAKIVQDSTRQGRAVVAAFLRKGQEEGRVDANLDPELAAAIVIGVIDGSQSIAIRDPELDKEKSGKLLLTMLLRLFAPPATADDA
ncbi:transcriptional regulator [Azospirillum sp. B510]|uniref:TetR/AcrR family transcriptional regulator n=1 Tax=Azospirillum sp. (strain B510) TaxID=137722 RepID=UPI0001C4BF3C|nr:TetR/AcrR family transcriptional regulator [Azospirillum sp. B510]BAI71761.1 transcriptional regulator [Azospirillum sp. B510]